MHIFNKEKQENLFFSIYLKIRRCFNRNIKNTSVSNKNGIIY